MILFSEQFHDINAGLVFSIGDENATPPDLAMSSDALMSELFQHRDTLLASTSPEAPPTEMFRQGTLLTPFLEFSAEMPSICVGCGRCKDCCSLAYFGRYLRDGLSVMHGHVSRMICA